MGPAWGLGPGAGPAAPTHRGVGALKVWGSQAKLLQKSFIQTQRLDLVASHCPLEEQGMRDFPGGGGVGAEGLGDLGRAWVRQEEAALIPQACPLPGSLEPRRGSPPLHPAPPTRLGGQPLPSKPSIPFPGWTCLWSGLGPWQS